MGNSRIIINNNIGFRPAPPRCGYTPYYGCYMPYNPWVGITNFMFGMQLINTMTAMSYSFYPYVNFSKRQNEENERQKYEFEAYKNLQQQESDLAALKNIYGEKYKIAKIGDSYYAVTKDSTKQLSGNSAKELMAEIDIDLKNSKAENA